MLRYYYICMKNALFCVFLAFFYVYECKYQAYYCICTMYDEKNRVKIFFSLILIFLILHRSLIILHLGT